MKPQTVKLDLGGSKYTLLPNTMTFYTDVERLTGADLVASRVPVTMTNVLAILWSAIDSYAASQEEECPVTLRQLGAEIDTTEKLSEVMKVVAEMMKVNLPEPEPNGKNPTKAARPNRSQRRAATKSVRSTSA